MTKDTSNKNKYVPVHIWMAEVNKELPKFVPKISRWKAYKLIRDKKFNEGDVRVEDVVQKRIRIKLSARPQK